MPLSAQVTFNGLGPLDDSGVREIGNCYEEGGLRFTVVGEACGMQPDDAPQALATYTADNGSFTGSPALFNNLGSFIDVTTTSGSAFSLLSIDLAPIFLGSGGGLLPVTFTGMRAAGAPMLSPMMVNVSLSAMALQTFSFSTFTDLTSLRIAPGAPDFSVQLDNVNVRGVSNVVPEPSTYLLMAVGLGGIGFIARRRARAS